MTLKTPTTIFYFLLSAVLLSATLISRDPEDEVTIHLQRRDTANTTVPFGTEPNNVTTLSIVLKGFEECKKNSLKYGTNVQWKKWIIDGFKEHDTLSQGQWINRPGLGRDRMGRVWANPDVEWNSAAAIEYFGPGYKNADYRDKIQANLDQHANMQYAWFFGWRIHVRCDEPQNVCLDKANFEAKDVATEAYTLHGYDDETCTPYNNHINFCPRYFQSAKLADALSTASNNQDRRDFLRDYWNRACVWAHEAMHITFLAKSFPTGGGGLEDHTIKNPQTSWSAYSTLDTKYLSFSDNIVTYASFNNPQNYAYYLLAKYVQKKYDRYPNLNVWTTNDEPPRPPPRNALIQDANNASVATAPTCRPTVLSVQSSASSTMSSATASTSCLVPAGCTNLAAPTGCAVACT